VFHRLFHRLFARFEPKAGTSGQASTYLPVLDGWRGLSILVVLFAHMLPLGPKAWRMNESFGLLGMAIFFTLSGFLIVSTLLHRANVAQFLIRRFCRIVPLAWVLLALALVLSPTVTGEVTPWQTYVLHFLFVVNLIPTELTSLTAHYWSLCMEMQFYGAIALLVLLFRQRGLMLLPMFLLLTTAFCLKSQVHTSVLTYYRIGEILSGGCLALVYAKRLGTLPLRFLAWVNPWVLLGLLALSCYPAFDALNYLRPYLAAALVGSTIAQPQASLQPLLHNRQLAYVATISYALYLIHPLSMYGPMSSGSTLIKYAKRPLAFALSFGFAHLSTNYEKFWIDLGKRWSNKVALATK
jgi:peptidoglycan/LPS O-acetylase OafA/YrhL